MTEQEWLVSDDPLRMLGMHAGPGYRTWLRPEHLDNVSDRKLRLYACAVSRLHPKSDVAKGFGDDHNAKSIAACSIAERWADGEITQKEAIELEPHCWIVMSPCVSEAARLMSDSPRRNAIAASLLREVIGNPYRPVTLPRVADCVVCNGTGRFILGSGGDAEAMACRCCPWLTPLVVSLAQAAYDERPGRVCEACDGTGKELSAVYEAGTVSPSSVTIFARSPVMNIRCPDCHGTGRVEDGLLDPVRLAVLADALEEAGVPDVICEECPKLEKAKITPDGYYDRDMVSEVIKWGERKRSCRCGGSGKTSHPLLAHLRSPGPHVRGCWSLDAILGKE